MIIARAAILVAIEYDENAACYLLLASFPWGKTASIGQVNEIRMISRSANAGMFKKMFLCHWRFPLKAAMFNGCPATKRMPPNHGFSFHQRQFLESPVVTNMNSHWLSEDKSTESHGTAAVHESGTHSDVT